MARRYHANDSSAMAGFLAPSRAAGATSARDHVADNVARVAAMEEVVSMRKALAEMPASPPKASSKYDHVTSRLAAAGVSLLLEKGLLILGPSWVRTCLSDVSSCNHAAMTSAGHVTPCQAVESR